MRRVRTAPRCGAGATRCSPSSPRPAACRPASCRPRSSDRCRPYRRMPAPPTWSSAVVEHVLDEVAAQPGLELDDLRQGRIQVHRRWTAGCSRLASEALEHGLARYERRHPRATGIVQGAVVVLRNRDGAILAETGGRQVYHGRETTASDFNRARQALRQPGSTMKPFVYLAAFERGDFTLDTLVPDEPISVPDGPGGLPKWIANYDGDVQGPDADARGARRIAQRGGDLADRADWHRRGAADVTRTGRPDAAAALSDHGTGRLGGDAAGVGDGLPDAWPRAWWRSPTWCARFVRGSGEPIWIEPQAPGPARRRRRHPGADSGGSARRRPDAGRDRPRADVAVLPDRR